MKQYHDALAHVMEHGQPSTDRTGTGTISAFGLQSRYAMADGFPLVTTKKLHLRSIIHELLWFLSGETNIAYLKENGVSIWDEWADADGDLGSRLRPSVAPLARPRGRDRPDRNPDEDDPRHARQPTPDRLGVESGRRARHGAAALSHPLAGAHRGGKLHLQLYQRSADMFLGVPFFSGVAERMRCGFFVLYYWFLRVNKKI